MLASWLLLVSAQSGLSTQFPDGWQASHAAISPEQRNGSPVVVLEPAEKTRPTFTLKLHKFPTDRKITLSIWFQGGEDAQWVSIDTKAFTVKRGHEIPAQIRVNPDQGYVTTQYARVAQTWTLVKKSIVVSRCAKTFSVEVMNLGKQPLKMASPSFVVGSKELCDLDGPGVLKGSIQVWVKAAEGHPTGAIDFPVPLKYGDQAPLAFKLKSDPPGAIKSYSFSKRADGVNWLCHVKVAAGSKPTAISWESLVFVRNRENPPLPKATTESFPQEVSPWLSRTACVQTDSPLILAKAKQLSSDHPDIETYARRVIRFTCDNRGGNEPWTRLDAVESLLCAGGGTCTNRANLAAALLRANNIPARTIAHLPTWNLGEPLFTHWLVEYWHPRVGWTRLESTWGEFEPPAYTTMIVAISSPADEDLAEDKLQTRWVLPGAPMWAMAHMGEDIVPCADQNQQANWVTPERRLSGSSGALSKLFQRAWASYDSLLISGRFADVGRYSRVERALRTGTASVIYGSIRH